jgi:pimeloyl-ACP methyl ester carboxylesterase
MHNLLMPISRHVWQVLCIDLAIVFAIVGCEINSNSSETAVPALAAPATAVPSPSAQITSIPAAVAASPSASPTTLAAQPEVPTAAPAPTQTPDITAHPLYPYTIAGLREREFPGGEIRIANLQEENEDFRRYYMVYPSDGLTITGAMNVPRGQGPFPVLILLHGYFQRDQYWTGADTWQIADFFARNGYLTIAPDYRSWGGSDSGPSFFHTGLVADVLNLISSLPSLPQADTERIALFGHSMGGGIATKVLLVDDRPAAAVLYSPNSADDADLIARWGPGCLPGQSQEEGDKCNPGEVIPPDLPPELVAAYLEAAGDAQMLQQIAPIYHLEDLDVPVQVYSGEADGELLVHTPPQWAQKLADTLQASGKEVQFFSYPGQGHYFEPPAWGEMINQALAFFNEQL